MRVFGAVLPLSVAFLFGIGATAPAGAISLRDAATAAGLFVGAAGNSFEIGTPAGDLLAREFNSVTPENEMKWSELSPAPFVYDFSRSDRLVAFAEENGMRMRGHTFVWGRPNGPTEWLAADLAAAPDPAARLQALMLDQIASVGARYAGRVHTWDVVNEPLAFASGALDSTSPYQQLLGETFLADAFHAARAADPGARLYLNETNTERLTGKFASLLALAEGLLTQGVPIDGIGLQGHFLAAPRKQDLMAQLRAIEALGLEAEITELDLPLVLFANAADPLAAQAQAYADVFAACLSVAACKGITTWGITDANTWLDGQPLFEFFAPNRPLLFDALGVPKPAYDAVLATLVAVPEPGTAAIVASGLVAMAARRRVRLRSGSTRRSASIRNAPLSTQYIAELDATLNGLPATTSSLGVIPCAGLQSVCDAPFVRTLTRTPQSAFFFRRRGTPPLSPAGCQRRPRDPSSRCAAPATQELCDT